MKLKREFLEFNKEILIGEIGAIIGAPFFGHATSYVTASPDVISGMAVLGAILGGGVLFLSTKAHHKHRRNRLSLKNIFRDLAYFTPAAFLTTFLVSYPILFFLSRHLQNYLPAFASVLVSEIAAFLLFLIIINLYRLLLAKHTGKLL